MSDQEGSDTPVTPADAEQADDQLLDDEAAHAAAATSTTRAKRASTAAASASGAAAAKKPRTTKLGKWTHDEDMALLASIKQFTIAKNGMLPGPIRTTSSTAATPAWKTIASPSKRSPHSLLMLPAKRAATASPHFALHPRSGKHAA